MPRLVLTIEPDSESDERYRGVYEWTLGTRELVELIARAVANGAVPSGPAADGAGAASGLREEDRLARACELLGDVWGPLLLEAESASLRLTIMTAAATENVGQLDYKTARAWIGELQIPMPRQWTAIWAHLKQRGYVKMIKPTVYKITPQGRRHALNR